MSNDSTNSYISLNALAQFKDADGKYHFDVDKQAAKTYIDQEIAPKCMKFSSIEERLNYLVAHKYYDPATLAMYRAEDVEALFREAYAFHFEFMGLMGAMKFYASYALRSDDRAHYLENFEDRAVMCALFLAKGDYALARALTLDILHNRFQPATPTFLNAGKLRRGEYISCYLLRIEDNMESIARGISTSLQLSKRGGGVALCLTNLRETSAPIKGFAHQASGVVPVMKLLEDSFSYANQLGQRQGAGAVYLHAHHKDIMRFLDTKRENADEKVRIKSLSLGVVIPDITFKLAQENKDMALFSPYDIEREYHKPMSDISITEEYERLLNNPRIKKDYISARKFFQVIAELQFESGYPYLMFEDTVNNASAHKAEGRIVMSNLCSEIAQVQTPSTLASDLSYEQLGMDVCCNLGSINIARAMDEAPKFPQLIEHAIYALDRVSRASDLACAPSVQKGNAHNHALGLGAMNLHGFLATRHIAYASPEAVDFTDMFFYALSYHAFRASCALAQRYGAFEGFAASSFADGSYFKKYTDHDVLPATTTVAALLAREGLALPTREDWKQLVQDIQQHGLANSQLMAVAPTGSISYLSMCTPSLQPVVSAIETRKEGAVGRVYVPAYQLSEDTMSYYQDGAYEVGYKAIIDIVAAAQKHVDQAISLTLFMTSDATTRDLNKAYIYAFKNKIKTIYYVRIRQDVLEGSEHIDERDMNFSHAAADASAPGASKLSKGADVDASADASADVDASAEKSSRKRPKNFVCTGASDCEACML